MYIYIYTDVADAVGNSAFYVYSRCSYIIDPMLYSFQWEINYIAEIVHETVCLRGLHIWSNPKLYIFSHTYTGYGNFCNTF